MVYQCSSKPTSAARHQVGTEPWTLGDGSTQGSILSVCGMTCRWWFWSGLAISVASYSSLKSLKWYKCGKIRRKRMFGTRGSRVMHGTAKKCGNSKLSFCVAFLRSRHTGRLRTGPEACVLGKHGAVNRNFSGRYCFSLDEKRNGDKFLAGSLTSDLFFFSHATSRSKLRLCS